MNCPKIVTLLLRYCRTILAVRALLLLGRCDEFVCIEILCLKTKFLNMLRELKIKVVKF